jgi:hypothetical protein
LGISTAKKHPQGVISIQGIISFLFNPFVTEFVFSRPLGTFFENEPFQTSLYFDFIDIYVHFSL